MVATDTVVGVVGALLLAAVMVGVFVYEYNNAPSPDGGGGNVPPGERLARFQKAYPALAADDDLDGDGNANYNDTDLDGDGVLDAGQQGDFVVRGTYTGTTAAPPGTQDNERPLRFGKGVKSFHGELNYTVAVPVPGTPRLPTLEFKLNGPDGSATGASTQSGGDVNVKLDPDAVGPGNYTLIVDQTQPGPTTPWTASFSINYGPAKPSG